MRLLALSLALALVGSTAPTQAQQNSGLDELVTRDDLRGWEPVGRVDEDDGGFCTGALIAADLVLTAAHCVVNPDGTPVDAARLTFRAGLSRGVALAESRVLRTIVPPGYRNIEPAPAEVIQKDVALLQLADPIPSSVISPFTVALPGPGDEVSVVSYAENRAESLSWQRICQVVARRDGLIAVDCDVTFGSSGAPVLERSGYRARIVSIISSGGELDGRKIAIGMELPALVDQLKAALRRGEATSETLADAAPSRLPGTSGKRIILGGEGNSGARFVKP